MSIFEEYGAFKTDICSKKKKKKIAKPLKNIYLHNSENLHYNIVNSIHCTPVYIIPVPTSDNVPLSMCALRTFK